MQRVWNIALLFLLNKGCNTCKLTRPSWLKQMQPPNEHVAGMPDGFSVVLLGVASGLEELVCLKQISVCLLVLVCLMVVLICLLWQWSVVHEKHIVLDVCLVCLQTKARNITVDNMCN